MLYYKLTTKDLDKKIQSAKTTSKMIMDSTLGKTSHFFDANGNKIRGYSNTVVKTRSNFHPLIQKYQ